MEVGERFRLKGDAGRVGVFTGQVQSRGGREHAKIAFPDRTEWVPTDQLEVVPEGGDTPTDLLRRGRLARPADLYRTLTHIRLSGRLANYIYSLDTTDTDFYAYQFKPVLKLLQSVSTGILIADEVGLGKTIEAGLIWTELRTRFDLQKLLVVCPAMLREKWATELRRRFGVKPEMCGARELVQLFREANGGTTPDFAAIASLQGLRPPPDWQEPTAVGAAAELARMLNERAADGPLVDLLVIDEAHYLRNPDTRSAELGRLLRKASQFAVLLSATPVHLRSDDLFYLLRIVDEDVFFRKDVFDFVRQANEHLIRAREAVLSGAVDALRFYDVLQHATRHPLLQGNRQLKGLLQEVEASDETLTERARVDYASRLEAANLLGFAVTRTRRRDVKEWRAVREARTLDVSMDPLEVRFYQTVTETVRDYCASSGQNEGFLLVMPQRQMSSCMAAALWYWTQDDANLKEELYEDLGLELPEAEPASLGPLISELRRRTATLGNLAELARHDTKYKRLRDELKSFLSAHSDEKVVLFSSFRHTLRYLAERLRNEGLSCALLLGGADDKQRTLEQFQDPRGPSILLSSEVGSEGIDLQFSWVLVNYDLPWNPMRVEQRIGRLDRLGQTSPKVAIWNLVHADTIDERIYQRLYMRLGIFEKTLGGLEVILGPRMSELARDLFRRQLTPEQEAARIDQTGIALENVRRQEDVLETEASSLVAYGDYILQQVDAARDMARRITAEDIQRYVLDFLSQNYIGCRLEVHPDEPTLVDIGLPPKAKNDLTEFLRERHARATTALSRSSATTVTCRFENRLKAPRRPSEEVVSQFHPLVRFVAWLAEERNLVQFPAVAARISRDRVPEHCRPGDYRIVVARWTFEALRPMEHLWYGVESIDPCVGPIGEEDAERFVGAVAEAGQDWPRASGALDLGQLTQDLEQGLLVVARQRFEQRSEQMKAQNEDRADAELKSLERHLQHQKAKYEEIRRRHQERGNPGLAKAQETNIRRLEDRVERKRLALEEKRFLHARMEEVCVGVVRVV